MPTFFEAQLAPNLNEIQLSAPEAHHAANVLRLKPGEWVRVANGAGLIAEGEIVQAESRKTAVRLHRFDTLPKSASMLTLAVSPVKSAERNDWLVEKATELGVDRLVFLQTERMEKARLKTARLEAKSISALKQCGRGWLPRIEPLTELSAWLVQQDRQADKWMVAHCMETVPLPLYRAAASASSFTLFIGPEGDFTPQEVDLLQEHGATPVSLGQLILRTETAAIAGLVQLQLLREMAL